MQTRSQRLSSCPRGRFNISPHSQESTVDQFHDPVSSPKQSFNGTVNTSQFDTGTALQELQESGIADPYRKSGQVNTSPHHATSNMVRSRAGGEASAPRRPSESVAHKENAVPDTVPDEQRTSTLGRRQGRDTVDEAEEERNSRKRRRVGPSDATALPDPMIPESKREILGTDPFIPKHELRLKALLDKADVQAKNRSALLEKADGVVALFEKYRFDKLEHSKFRDWPVVRKKKKDKGA